MCQTNVRFFAKNGIYHRQMTTEWL